VKHFLVYTCMNKIAVALILLFLTSCQTTEKRYISKPIRQTFKFPVYNIQYSKFAKPATLWKVDTMMLHLPSVIDATYTFQDTILRFEMFGVLKPAKSYKRVDTTATSGKDLTLLADYTQHIVVSNHKNHFCYPVYVINNQKTPALFTGTDSKIRAMQEALHPNGKWYPIELSGFITCGNSLAWEIRLLPKEYTVFFVPKYQGDFQTKIRIRLQTGRDILVSEPFMGYISMKQFLISNYDKHWILKILQEGKWRGNLGATPFEADTITLR
jgi:hypothetical protein